VDIVLEQKEEIEELMKETGRDIPEVHEILASVEKICGVS
jgi:predicted transcriptional regulator